MPSYSRDKTFSGPDEARALARMAHLNQVDKAGKPYFDHLVRVAYSAHDTYVKQLVMGKTFLPSPTTANDILAVGFLHDIIEDTEVELDDLLRLNFSPDVVKSVVSVTKGPVVATKLLAKKDEICPLDFLFEDLVWELMSYYPYPMLHETYQQFVDRASHDLVGRYVKYADIKDHLRPSEYELPKTMRERYEKALPLLGFGQ